MQIDGSGVPLPPTPPGTQQNLAFIPGPSSDHQSLIVMPSSSSSVQPPPISLQAQVPTQMLLTNPQASTAHVSGSPQSSTQLVSYHSVGGTNLSASEMNASGNGTETFIHSDAVKDALVQSQKYYESQAHEALRSMHDRHVREAKNFEEQMQDQEKAKLAQQQAVYQQSLAQASRDAQMQSARQFQEKELKLKAEAESALLSVQGQAQTALDAEKQKLYIAEQGADYWKIWHSNHQMKPIAIEVNFKKPKNISNKPKSRSKIGSIMFNVEN